MSTKPIRRTFRCLGTHANPGSEKHWAVGGTARYVLDGCGHEVVRKWSNPPGKTILCPECERLRMGITTRQRIGDAPPIETTWDAEAQLPKTRELTLEEWDRDL